jgi:RecA-family ATPase
VDIDRELGDYALEYAGRGWAVLPLHSVANGRCSCQKADCQSPGKHPLNTNGVTGATTDREIIIGWWGKWPWANIGVATGSISGIAVVDVDPRNGGLDHLADLHLPDTLIAETGGKGYHYYYRQDGPKAKGKVTPGIDLQADGGYVVAPPSIHLLGEYKWQTNLPLAPLPSLKPNGKSTAPLLDAPATTPVTREPSSSTIIEPDGKQWVADLFSQPCPKGTRNATLTRLSGYFRNLLPEPVTNRILLAWNAAHCSPPLTDSEVRQNIRHKYRRYESIAGTPEDVDDDEWTLSELLDMDLPDPPCIIDGLLPVGLSILAGRPKRGKSMMAWDIAGCVAHGREYLGRNVEQGKAVYIALEDSKIRLKKRSVRMAIDRTADLIGRTSLPTLDRGGVPKLLHIIEKYQPKLIVIDTLGRALSGHVDQDAVGEMTDVLGTVQRIAHEYSVAIMIVDHHKKGGMEGKDVIDDVLGSTGKTAVADSIWGLYRRSGESIGTLSVTGRDIEEQQIDIAWDGINLRWKISDSPSKSITERRIEQLMELIRQTDEVDIATFAKQIDVAYNTAKEVIWLARDQGLIEEIFVRTAARGGSKSVYRISKTISINHGTEILK